MPGGILGAIAGFFLYAFICCIVWALIVAFGNLFIRIDIKEAKKNNAIDG